MEPLKQAILAVLQDYLDYLKDVPDLNLQLIADEKNHHDLLLQAAWQDSRRIYGPIIHMDIIDHKIWIQHDSTEDGIANHVVAIGIAKQQIVLAFKCPERRKITDFAIA